MMDKKRLGKVIGIVCFVSGALLLSSITVPILSYEIKSQTDFVDYISPIPEIGEQSDPNSWLPESLDTVSSEIGYYTLTIPKLGIRQATVAIGGEDLADSLIQFPGTALPGKIGNSVIFGHSVLPAFYNPEVYLSIFSTLPTLKKNDKIYLDYDGIRYEYIVTNSYEVLPTNLEVLSQNKNQPTISLITCVPPGDPRRPRRLVVEATLTPIRGVR